MEMTDNDLALLAAIWGNLTSEDALAAFGIKPKKLPPKNLHLTVGQAENIKFLNKTMSWTDLAAEFGINGEALRQQVYKALKKNNKTKYEKGSGKIETQSRKRQIAKAT